MFEVVYSSTTQREGESVPLSYLNDCGISFEDCKTLTDYENAIEGHDDFEVRGLSNE